MKEIKLDVKKEQVEQKKEQEKKQTNFEFVIIQDNHKTICMITEKFAARVQRFIKFFAPAHLPAATAGVSPLVGGHVAEDTRHTHGRSHSEVTPPK